MLNKKIQDVFNNEIPLLEIKNNRLFIDGEELDHTNIIGYKVEGAYEVTECSIKFLVRT